MDRRAPTRADVARAAGVSVASVSYAFEPRNEKISSATRERILEKAQELGYRPNLIAGSLRRGRTDLVGMLIPDITNPFFNELARAVENECYQHDLMLLLASAENDFEREDRHIQSFVDMQVTGVIMTTSGHTGTLSKYRSVIERTSTPFISLDRYRDAISGAQTIAVDNVLGAEIATEHLLQHGRRKLLCISGPNEISSSLQRSEGFMGVCAKVEDAHGWICSGEFSFESGYQIAKQALATGIESIDSIFACSDVQALGAMQAIQELGYAIPEDVAVIGFDGAREGRYFRPSLSTIVQPIDQLAKLAVGTLAEASSVSDQPTKPILLAPKLRRRNSCGCVLDESREGAMLI